MAGRPAARSPGGKFLRKIEARYDLTEAELVLLEHAARVLNRIDSIETELESATLTVPGMRPGHVVAHPLIAEERGQRTLLRGLIKDLAIPDDIDVGERPKLKAAKLTSEDRSAQARKAATARWAATK